LLVVLAELVALIEEKRLAPVRAAVGEAVGRQPSSHERAQHRRRRHHNRLPRLQSLFVLADATGNPPASHSPIPFLDEYLTQAGAALLTTRHQAPPIPQ